MNNLMRLGAVMKYLYAICFCVLPIYVMLFWITNGFPLGAGTPMQVFLYEGPTLPAISTFPVSVKIIAFLINMIPVSLYMLLLGFLIRLFHCFSRGEILSLRIVKYIRYAAWTFLGAQLIRPIYSFLMSLLVVTCIFLISAMRTSVLICKIL